MLTARVTEHLETRSGGAICMPAAPCTSGSTITAASSGACSATIVPRLSKQSGSAKCGARSTGNRNGSNRSVPNPPSPTDSAPIVSPWYAPPKARNVVRPVDATVHPVLEGDLQRLLDGRRAVGREQEVRRVDRHERRQRFAQLDDDPVAVAEHGRVRTAVELLADGVVELGHAVTERVHPQRRDGVEVALAVDVDQLVALGAVDDDRRALGEARHLREPVPHHAGVALRPHGRLVHRAMMPRDEARGSGARTVRRSEMFAEMEWSGPAPKAPGAGMMSLRDKTAVVGVGSTPYYKRGQSLPQTPFELAGKAVLAAVEDAGLTIDDVDGLALYSMGLGGDTSLFAQVLGIPEVRFTATLTGGGGGAAGSVGLAAAAITAGMAECVVSLMTLQQASSRFGASYAPRQAGRAVLRAAVTGGQLHPAGRPDGSRPDVRRAHDAACASLRHEA